MAIVSSPPAATTAKWYSSVPDGAGPHYSAAYVSPINSHGNTWFAPQQSLQRDNQGSDAAASFPQATNRQSPRNRAIAERWA
jgi:hypothetical protein